MCIEFPVKNYSAVRSYAPVIRKLCVFSFDLHFGFSFPAVLKKSVTRGKDSKVEKYTEGTGNNQLLRDV